MDSLGDLIRLAFEWMIQAIRAGNWGLAIFGLFLVAFAIYGITQWSKLASEAFNAGRDGRAMQAPEGTQEVRLRPATVFLGMACLFGFICVAASSPTSRETRQIKSGETMAVAEYRSMKAAGWIGLPDVRSPDVSSPARPVTDDELAALPPNAGIVFILKGRSEARAFLPGTSTPQQRSMSLIGSIVATAGGIGIVVLRRRKSERTGEADDPDSTDRITAGSAEAQMIAAGDESLQGETPRTDPPHTRVPSSVVADKSKHDLDARLGPEQFRVIGTEISSGRRVELLSRAPTTEFAHRFGVMMGLDPKSVVVEAIPLASAESEGEKRGGEIKPGHT
jgi:hypothetical protein